MRILYIYPEEFRGLAAREYHIYRLANALAAAGSEVTLAAGVSKDFDAVEKLAAIFREPPHPRLRMVWLRRKLGPFRWGGWLYRQLDRFLSGEELPDAVYTMHLKAADHFRRQGPALPVVFEAHEIFADSYAPDHSKHRELTMLEQRLYPGFRGVVAISPYLLEGLRRRYGVSCPSIVQHDGVEDELLRLPFENADPAQLIYAGSLQPWKGVPVAVAAMRLLPEFRLTVAGGHGKALETLKRGAPDNVTFTGHLSREALMPHLARASMGLMPNLAEPASALSTFPLKLLEYSAAGKGIVASHIPVFDGLPVGDWVRLAEPGSPEKLAAAVRALAAVGPKRDSARAWARQFAWPAQGRHLLAFLESVIKTNPASAT
ncbi:MAG TPA: glycosyltransferase family 4 protein [Candidatus Methylacidiphilales bacterium]|nr:glycosyltransferase family 4 protein [Candidatus Methylacidiphilales bacterium]